MTAVCGVRVKVKSGHTQDGGKILVEYIIYSVWVWRLYLGDVVFVDGYLFLEGLDLVFSSRSLMQQLLGISRFLVKPGREGGGEVNFNMCPLDVELDVRVAHNWNSRRTPTTETNTLSTITS